MTSQHVSFTLIDHARRPEPRLHALIRDARLPIAWWRAVAVRRWADKSISRLEQFVLEAALALGSIDGTELTEITGLPGSLLPALTRRLVGTGILYAAGDRYDVEPRLGAAALSAGQLRVEEVGRTDLIYLLDTDELVAIDPRPSKDPLSKLDNRQLDPAYRVPVDARVAQTPRSDFFADRIRERRVIGLSDRVFDVVRPAQDEPLLGDGFCPVYRCEAVVRPEQERLVIELTIHGQSVRKRRGQDSTQRRVTMHLAGAHKLAAVWAGAADLLCDPQLQASAWTAIISGPPAERPPAEPPTAAEPPSADGPLIEPPPAATRAGPLTWCFRLTGESVEPLFLACRDLSRPLVLEAGLETFTAHLVAELTPADPVAAAHIGVDQAIAAAERADCDPAELHRLLAELAGQLPIDAAGHLAPDAVLDRAWQLGRYRLAYALRQNEDFAYA
jgi:hypothetical protein